MTAPNMATITASLERSLQNFSLNRDGSCGFGRSASSDEPEDTNADHISVDLNSQVAPLPYQWEQCLDLKTGEIYYIDWKNGRKAKEDPRKKTASRAACGVLDFYSTEEDSSSYSYNGGYEYDSEGSSSTTSTTTLLSSSSSSSSSSSRNDDCHRYHEGGSSSSDHVLVVAGCKRCFMYFMLPKQVQECPKCNGLILHFDRS